MRESQDLYAFKYYVDKVAWEWMKNIAQPLRVKFHKSIHKRNYFIDVLNFFKNFDSLTSVTLNIKTFIRIFFLCKNKI